MLDTPAEECIGRIYRRREQRRVNVGAPLNVRKHRENHRRIKRLVDRGAGLGVPVVTLNDAHAYDQLHDLLVYGGWPCNRHAVQWSFAVSS